MINVQQRTEAFIRLGQFLRKLDEEKLMQWSRQAEANNKWFTAENVKYALGGIVAMLEEKSLRTWLGHYKINTTAPKKVGVIMAGNIPMVGFHDMMCVLLVGHICGIKLSSQDSVLLKKIVEELLLIEPAFKDQILWLDQVKNMDAVIATGSDNTARHFEYYFSSVPNIIRKNRVSVAVLNGKETDHELELLVNDMFMYFGLGCRNVSKLFVPANYDFSRIMQTAEKYADLFSNNKYMNNHAYNRSVYLMNQQPHLDNGFLLLKEDEALVSPVSVTHFEYYNTPEEAKQKIESNIEKIQCVVAYHGFDPNAVPFGKAQCPGVDDYADGVDTMRFLMGVNSER